jgi:hypothetical protein
LAFLKKSAFCYLICPTLSIAFSLKNIADWTDYWNIDCLRRMISPPSIVKIDYIIRKMGASSESSPNPYTEGSVTGNNAIQNKMLYIKAQQSDSREERPVGAGPA